MDSILVILSHRLPVIACKCSVIVKFTQICKHCNAPSVRSIYKPVVKHTRNNDLGLQPGIIITYIKNGRHSFEDKLIEMYKIENLSLKKENERERETRCAQVDSR